MSAKQFLVLAFLGLIAAAGCSSSGSTPAFFTRALPLSGSPRQYITHVVVIIQENRSFENFFTGYPGANAPASGCAIPEKNARPEITRQVERRGLSSACPPGDISVALKPITFDSVDLGHNWQSSKVSWDKGKMDGFSKFCCIGGPYPAYSYVERSLITPYWDMARQYVLADEMFPTEWGGSFTGHLMLVAGTDDIHQSPSEAEIDNPTAGPYDCDSPPGTKSSYVTSERKVEMNKGPFPCFDQWNSIAEVLDNAGVSWKYYANRKLDAGIWEPFEALKYVRYGARLGQHHRTADEDINRSRQGGLGIRKLCHSEPKGLRSPAPQGAAGERPRPFMGGIGSQCDRREFVLGLHCDRRPVG